MLFFLHIFLFLMLGLSLLNRQTEKSNTIKTVLPILYCFNIRYKSHLLHPPLGQSSHKLRAHSNISAFICTDKFLCVRASRKNRSRSLNPGPVFILFTIKGSAYFTSLSLVIFPFLLHQYSFFPTSTHSFFTKAPSGPQKWRTPSASVTSAFFFITPYLFV